MADPSSRPQFTAFTRWLAESQPIFTKQSINTAAYERLLGAARSARDETMRSMPRAASRFETLQLLAAATKDSERPPELTTARGFRVTLAFEDGHPASASSIAVLVQCPIDMIASMQGEIAYLWNGSERFALGQFDADGKVLGTLPAGVGVSLGDFKQGRIKLEEPSSPLE
jgi:hypothetical protein